MDQVLLATFDPDTRIYVDRLLFSNTAHILSIFRPDYHRDGRGVVRCVSTLDLDVRSSL